MKLGMYRLGGEEAYAAAERREERLMQLFEFEVGSPDLI